MIPLKNDETLAMWISFIRRFAKRMGKGNEGAGLAEYALLLVLIAVVILSMVVPIGAWIKNVFEHAVDMYP